MAVAACLMVCPLPAHAQAQFLAAVRDLAASATAQLPTPNAKGPTTTPERQAVALARMKAGLAEWDRGIAALESRVAGELRDASRLRAFQLHVELGLAYRQRGWLDQALRQFDAAAADQPEASDVHLLHALTLEAAGNSASASQAVRTAWLRDAANPIKAYLALRHVSALEPVERERAQKVLREALDAILARTDRRRGAPFIVLDPITDTLSQTPIVGDAALAGVFASLAEGRLDEALAGAGPGPAASGGADDSPLAHFLRGKTHEIEGRPHEARQAYTAALRGTLTGRHVLFVAIGRLAQVEGELEAAIHAFERATRLHPNDSAIHRELAGASATAGRYDDAFAELVAALLVDPASGEAMAAIAQLFLDRDQADAAVAVLTAAIEAEPDRLQTQYALAVALRRAGKSEDAMRQFERFERMSRDQLEERRRRVIGQPDAPLR